MQGAIMGDLWKRPDPSRRDRSIVTPSCLIARNQTIEMPYYSIWHRIAMLSQAKFLR